MSKENNLKDFLTDIADAVREKKGTTEPINAQNLSDEIRSIESGGGCDHAPWDEPEENDVNFYDYDGTLLYAYSWDEASQMTELPTPPNRHKGLIFDGWNYTLEDMLAQGNYANIGAMYMPENGRTRLKVKPVNGKVSIFYTQSEQNGVKVYWGDGSEEVHRLEGFYSLEHKYTDSKERYIELEVLSGNLIFENAKVTLLNKNITDINIGRSVVVGNYAFYYCTVNSISFSNSVISCGGRIQKGSIKYLGLPNTTFTAQTTLYESNFELCSIPLGLYDYYRILPTNKDLKTIVFHSLATYDYTESSFTSYFPKIKIKVSANNQNFFSGKGALVSKENKLVLGDITGKYNKNATTLGKYSYGYREIERFDIIGSITNVNALAFWEAFAKIITVGENVNTIGGSAFSSDRIKIIDFSRCKSIPTIESSSTILSPLAIIVPDGTIQEWSTATNLSTKSSLMIEAKDNLYITEDVKCEMRDITDTFLVGEYIPIGSVGNKQDYKTSSASNTCYLLIDIDGEDVVRITGRSGSVARLYCFVDEQDVVISVCKSNISIDEMLLKIPQNAKKMIINNVYDATYKIAPKVEIGKIIKSGNQ